MVNINSSYHCQILIENANKNWDKRVTTSLFGMYCVDAWLMYKRCTSTSWKDTPKLSQQEFYCQLAEQLIDNNQERICTRNCPIIYREFDFPHNQSSRLSSVPILRAIKKLKTGTGGKLTKFCPQGCCHVCIKACPTTVCSLYKYELGKTLYLCGTHRGQICFKIHIQNGHSYKYK